MNEFIKQINNIENKTENEFYETKKWQCTSFK